MRFAIIVGHDEFKKGACYPGSPNNEYDYNSDLANKIVSNICSYKHEGLIVKRHKKNRKQVANIVNDLNVKASIELHCNAYNRSVMGSETLYLSKKDIKLARAIHREIVYVFNRKGKHNRGVKKLFEYNRGYSNLKYIKCPAILIEPFFIDNVYDMIMALQKKESLANAIANGLLRSCKK